MMQNYKNIIPFAVLSLLISGCATSYSNKELQNMFIAKGFDTKETERGVVVFLPGLFFEYDKSDLTPDAQAKVADIATITNDPGVVDRFLLIEGHTDSTGSDEYNLDLSNRRAKSVEQNLSTGKVNPARMTTRGYGEKYPVAENTMPDGSPNPDGQAKNRRVEVVIKNLEEK
jgi:outer membrane protein OmpA-like peptidoglycan-associated protein